MGRVSVGRNSAAYCAALREAIADYADANKPYALRGHGAEMTGFRFRVLRNVVVAVGEMRFGIPPALRIGGQESSAGAGPVDRP